MATTASPRSIVADGIRNRRVHAEEESTNETKQDTKTNQILGRRHGYTFQQAQDPEAGGTEDGTDSR